MLQKKYAKCKCSGKIENFFFNLKNKMNFTVKLENEIIDVPEYLKEDETSLYQLKEHIRKVKNVDYDSISLKIFRKNVTNDNVFICNGDVVNVILQERKILVPKKLKTGNNLEVSNVLQNITECLSNYLSNLTNSLKEDAEDDSNYIGDLLNGVPHGKGRRTFVYFYIYDTVYDGEWKNGKYDGYGIRISKSTKELFDKYQIDFEEKKKLSEEKFGFNYNAKIFENFQEPEETVYEGFWRNGKLHGQGKKKDYEGILEGNFTEGDIIGQAKMTYKNGDVYEGGWDMECKQGKGKITYANGKIFEGEWIDDELM